MEKPIIRDIIEIKFIDNPNQDLKILMKKTDGSSTFFTENKKTKNFQYKENEIKNLSDIDLLS